MNLLGKISCFQITRSRPRTKVHGLAIQGISCILSTLRVGLLALFSLCVLPFTAYPENLNSIFISGLSFQCSGCELRNETPCEVYFSERKELLRCDLAVEQLLEQIVNSEYDEQHPSPSELRSVLIGSQVKEKSAEYALQLLLRSAVGRQALVHEAYIFAGKYPKILAELFKRGEGTSEVWLAFWRVPDSEGVRLDASLRASIVLRETTLSANDLFEDLSLTNLKQDSEDLRVYEETLQKERSDLAEAARTSRELLEKCSRAPIEETANVACLPDALKSLPETVQKYIQRVQVQQIILWAKDAGTEAGVKKLQALLRVNYQDFRTPEIHNIVLETLVTAKKLTQSERQAILDNKFQALFELFAQNDHEIQSTLNDLLVEEAQVAWTGRDLETCFQYLERSLLLVTGSQARRDELLTEIESSDIRFTDAAWEKHFPTISLNLGNKTASRFGLQEVFAWVALFFGLVGLVLLFAYAFRERRLVMAEAEYEAEILRAKEESELLELREFFQISENEGIPELTKNYRKKAKEMHPDRDGGETSVFQDLQEKYIRAQELIVRLTAASDASFSQGEEAFETDDDEEVQEK